jgi:hypothetical protein
MKRNLLPGSSLRSIRRFRVSNREAIIVSPAKAKRKGRKTRGTASLSNPTVQTLLRARLHGATLRLAAALAGVHVSTVCRWQARNPELRQALAEAARRPPPDPRPRVRWRKDCPLCRARVVVRTARGGARFWRCGRWPLCSWASWRQRAPRNCSRCGAPRYWSHSRKSISCSACGMRTRHP